MAKKKTPTKKKITQRSVLENRKGNIAGATALLFAAGCIALLGLLQADDNLVLLLVGFASALAFIGAVLLGMTIYRR